MKLTRWGLYRSPPRPPSADFFNLNPTGHIHRDVLRGRAMTILTVLLLTVVSTCLAQPAEDNAKERSVRTPQSQIQYRDPDGLKVDWKLFAPQNQWRSHLESSQRRARTEGKAETTNFAPKQQPQVVQPPVEVEPQYQPYSSIPNHIKQLIVESYSSQGPYVDPGAFFYQTHNPAPIASLATRAKDDQSALAQTRQLEQAYFRSGQGSRIGQIGKVPVKGGIKYKDEEKSTERSNLLPFGVVLEVKSQEKLQYQPYKQMAQSAHAQYGRQLTQRNSEYERYKEQASQPQPQYVQYGKQPVSAQAQYPHYNKQPAPAQAQYAHYSKQPAQAQMQYSHQISQPQYVPYNKQASQLPQYNKQAAQSQQYKQMTQLKPIKPVSETHFEHDMPMAIQQLLSYQSQLPYNVIANHIIYRPKQLFIPKPLPESAKLAKHYPSKIYFVKTDGQIYDSPEMAKGEENEKRY